MGAAAIPLGFHCIPSGNPPSVRWVYDAKSPQLREGTGGQLEADGEGLPGLPRVLIESLQRGNRLRVHAGEHVRVGIQRQTDV